MGASDKTMEVEDKGLEIRLLFPMVTGYIRIELGQYLPSYLEGGKNRQKRVVNTNILRIFYVSSE